MTDEPAERDIRAYFGENVDRKHGVTQFTVKDIIDIFALLSCGVPVATIATKYSVTQHAIYKIKAGERWGWVRTELMKRDPFADTLRHDWAPDMDHKGKFKCQACGMRFSEIMMETKCPEAVKEDEKPVHVDWAPPPNPRKRKEPAFSIPGADLKRVRKYNEMKDKPLKFKGRTRSEYWADYHAAKEKKRQETLKSLEELKQKQALEELAKALNKPPTP